MREEDEAEDAVAACESDTVAVVLGDSVSEDVDVVVRNRGRE